MLNASLTDESRRTVTEYIKARGAWDRERVAELVTPDVEWVFPRSADRPALTGAEAIDGLAGGLAAKVFDKASLRIEVNHLIAEGELVAVHQTVTATKLDGGQYENDYVWIFELRGGRIARAVQRPDTLMADRLLGGRK